jgi:hypothetical protein
LLFLITVVADITLHDSRIGVWRWVFHVGYFSSTG